MKMHTTLFLICMALSAKAYAHNTVLGPPLDPRTEGNVAIALTGTNYGINADDYQRICGDPTAEGTEVNQVHIQLSAKTGSPALGLNDRITLFWRQNDDGCDSIPENEDSTGYIARLTITTLTDPLVLRSSFDIPADFGSEVLTERDIMEAFASNACDNATDSSVARPEDGMVTLCLVADKKSGSIWNNSRDKNPTGLNSITDEYFALLHFELDTVAPPKPSTPTAIDKDGSLDVRVSFSKGTDPGDVARWRIHYINLEESPDAAAPGADCTTWPTAESVSATTLTLDNLNNGSTYALCVLAIDDAGNTGTPSDIIEGQPQNECDFAECYPDNIQYGYCSAGLALPNLCGLLLLGFLMHARRRTLNRKILS